MNTGKQGIELIKHFEQIHDGDKAKEGLQPMLCPANVWTSGYGHAIVDPKTGKQLKGASNKARAYELNTVHTVQDAEKLLIEDLKRYENIVNKKLKVKLDQNAYDALVSHTYNTGGSDTLFRLINKEDWDAVRQWWTTKYTTANGKTLKGLVRRRKSEYILFSKDKLEFDV